MPRTEIRIAGAGAHGVIEAGLILQEAAAIYDDLNAHHVQSYGPEARSDIARSEVIISDGDIDYPKATQLDALLATTQEAAEKYVHDIKLDGVLVLDSSVNWNPPKDATYKLIRLPILKEADAFQKSGLTHVVALGALVGASHAVSRPAIEAAVKDHVPRGSEDLYARALSKGFELLSL